MTEVLAAGALVRRQAASGEVEVLVVHRPRYDDWSFPKGKCDSGETFEQTARREVAEETGFDVELDEELPEVRYRDHHDRPKLVRYWTATVLGGSFTANDEVDEIAWLPLVEAAGRLSYPHDAELLSSLPTA